MDNIAWAAGLFEGEGSILTVNGYRSNIRLSLASVDRDVLDRFAAVAGGSVTGPYQHWKNERQPIWSWQVARVAQVQSILRMFWPYLGERRRARAAEAFALYYEAPVKRMKVRR